MDTEKDQFPLAVEMKRVFGDKCRVIKVKMLHRRVIGKFIQKIERAHKQAGKSKLIFK